MDKPWQKPPDFSSGIGFLWVVCPAPFQFRKQIKNLESNVKIITIIITCGE